MRKPILLTIMALLALIFFIMETGDTVLRPGGNSPENESVSIPEPEVPSAENDYVEARRAMVSGQLRKRGISDARVLASLESVPRHRFVLPGYEYAAYRDHPLPIGFGQTISQPYIVALMTERAGLQPTDRVLEIGTGSGYQSAVLSRLVEQVFTIEIVPGLADRAAATLSALGYANVTVRTGDGYEGWPEQAPFDAILVTAAPEEIPEALLDQLAPGGRMVIPVGPTFGTQYLKLIQKDETGVLREERIIPVRFVPMVHGQNAD